MSGSPRGLAPKARIGVLMADPQNPFWIDMKACYDRLAPSMGVQITVQWPERGQDPDAQLDSLRRMLGGGFDLIVVNPLGPVTLAPGILEAAAKGLPVMDVGGKTDREFVRGAGDRYIPLLTVDFQEQGRLGGGFLARALETSGRKEAPWVAILSGRPDAAQSKGRCQGAEEVLADRVPACRIVRAAGRFDRRQGEEAARAVLSEQPDIRAFFCANDLMALGVADLFDRDSGAARPRIVGVDGIPEAVDAVRDGRMAATVAFSRDDVARAVLETALDVLSGGPPPTGYLVPSRLVTFSPQSG